MNAKKSLVLFIVGGLIFGGAVLGFAHGAQLTDTDVGTGALWMGGSLAVMALEVFAAVKINTSK